ncbi:MAG TPA: hypothetical protein VGA19_11940, partial [Rhodospirillales bacterium]
MAKHKARAKGRGKTRAKTPGKTRSGAGPGVPPGIPPVIGVIGGSGIYDIDGLKNARWRKVASPFGQPSDEFLTG